MCCVRRKLKRETLRRSRVSFRQSLELVAIFTRKSQSKGGKRGRLSGTERQQQKRRRKEEFSNGIAAPKEKKAIAASSSRDLKEGNFVRIKKGVGSRGSHS